MSSDQFKPTASQDGAKAQNTTNRERAGAGTSSRSQEGSANATYTQERHNCTDRRTDIRTADRHYSWREVHHANHTEPGR